MNAFAHTLRLALFLIMPVCLLSACGGGKTTVSKHADTLRMEYSRLLHIEQFDSYRLVTIKDPWVNDATLHRYALVDKKSKVPSDLSADVTIVRVPLQKMCVSTSVHANLYKQLDALDHVGSVCDVNYIIDPLILKRIDRGLTGNAGSSMNPNIERILQYNTDALLMSPFKGTSYGILEKTGLPIIECADYMETSTLGRAEWVKFYGMLVGREREADSLFNLVRNNYDKLKNTVSSGKTRPKLLVDMLNGQSWYMPGGNSIYGTLYRDAGAEYRLGKKNTGGTQALTLEAVMTEALDADVWIIKYGATEDYTYDFLARQNKAYTRFKAFRNRKVYGCNTLRVPFYDEVPFRPDLLFADLLSIFHPDLLPDHKPRYYFPLK